MRRRSTAGMTLLEVLISVTLMALLMVGMSIAMRVGLSAYQRTTDHLMENRRVAGAQRILQSELEGLMPVMPPCLGMENGGNVHFVFLQAEPQYLRMVSTYSLQEGWRGVPQILEFFIIPGEKGRGVRLVVNETPYTPSAAGNFCSGTVEDATFGITIPRFPAQPQAKESTFVLADKLAACKFSYYSRSRDPNEPFPKWLPRATGLGWPLAIRIDLQPLDTDTANLQPISVLAQLRLHRAPDIPYGDF
jgi:hypothetical protein